MNQVIIPDYQYCLCCKAKRMVRIKFLEKKFVIQSDISIYSLIIADNIFEKIEILLAQGVVQIRPNSEWSIASVVRAENQKYFLVQLA